MRKHDIVVAKNYLAEDEIDTLNRLVVIFLETAELRAKRRQDIPMRFWMENVGQIIASNGFALLEGAGTVSREQMEADTDARWLGFDERRKKEEARAADAADEAELAALESRIKRRKKP